MWKPVDHPVEDYFTHVFDRVIAPLINTRITATIQREMLLEPLSYTIKVTPGRKFRSVLPVVLSDFKKPTIYVAAAIEILWAAYTILDDLSEGQCSRYGSKTAWVKFGTGRATYSVPFTFVLVKELLSEAFPSNMPYNNSVITSLEISYYAHLDHFTWDIRGASVEDYLELAKRKVQFITDLWPMALNVSGCDSLGKLVSLLHKETAIGGQIKNDLQNIWEIGDHKGCCSDIIEGCITYPILSFRDLANKKDFNSFMTFWNSNIGSLNIESIVRLRTLFGNYQIYEKCKEQISFYVEQAVKIVSDNSISNSLRNLLLGWINLQFEDDLNLTITNWRRKLSGVDFPMIPYDI